ncbi:MAG: 2-phosphosulfolactate phosphatase [Acetomicrobium sp.]|nr:2-phosphosulfolactate phosphatase [Acetomicrobium sp.]
MSVQLTVVLNPSGDLDRIDTWIVVDILRATTTIVTFFEMGGKVLLPVEDVEEAYSLKSKLGGKWLLMGERKSLPPPGFDCGNSPIELLRYNLRDFHGAIMTTTNGTKALLRAAASSGIVFAGCSRNATAVVEAAIERGNKIGILCAGRFNRAMIDDTACAGMMAEIAKNRNQSLKLNDGAKIAIATWEYYDKNLMRAMTDAEHALSLKDLGLWSDVEYASRIDESHTIPRLTRWNNLPAIMV